MIFYSLIVLCLSAGVAISIQGFMNVVLQNKFPLPVVVFINTIAGIIGALIWVSYWKISNTETRLEFSGTPFWLYFSGFLGLLIVIAGATAFPKLGATWALSLMILGQLSLGLLADHYGWFGVAKAPLALPRILGASLVLIGCWLTSFRTS